MDLLSTIIALIPTVHAALPIDQINLGSADVCVFDSVGFSCRTDLIGFLMGLLVTGNTTRQVFSLVLFVMIVFYGIKLILTSRNESAYSEAAMSYVNALIGTILVAGVSIIANLVRSHTVLVNTAAIPAIYTNTGGGGGLIFNIYVFIKTIVIGFIIINLFLQGTRLILSLNDGDTDSARQGLLRTLLGAAIVLICSPIILAITPGSSVTGIETEIVGIANFLLTFFGSLAVLGFIVAGILFLVSVEDSLRERAQKLMIASIVSLIVIISSYALISIFV